MRAPIPLRAGAKLALAAIWLQGQIPDKSWRPITDAEFAVKNDPRNPGAHAVILNREVVSDDTLGVHKRRLRIKILTEEGRKYADVEIPYFPKLVKVEELRGRTVSPDGRSQEFNGEVYDRVLAKAKGLDAQAKYFSLPGVQKGSIIEYSYQLRRQKSLPEVVRFPGNYPITQPFTIHAETWMLDHELSTLSARFAIHPWKGRQLYWCATGLKGVASPKVQPDGSMELKLENIGAFLKEYNMPPEDAIRSSISFYYIIGDVFSPSQFWIEQGRAGGEKLDRFIGEPKQYRKEVEKLVQPSDSQELQLRKLYARVQEIRALSMEQDKPAEELKRQGIKENKHADDVLKHGYAWRDEITFLFVALARAAGFEAKPVLVSDRAIRFFDENAPDSSQLDAVIAEVHTAAKDFYLDPAIPDCPFDLLPWQETAMKGLTLEKESRWIRVPTPDILDALTTRRLAVQLDLSGSVKGELTVTFGRQEALSMRRQTRRLDESSRVKMLEDGAKSWLPAGASVKLCAAGDWKSPDKPLQASFNIEISNHAASTGRRLLLPAVPVRIGQSELLEHAARTHPVYNAYPYERVDTISIRLPAGFGCEKVPSPIFINSSFGSYQLSARTDSQTIELNRRFVMNAMLIEASEYPVLWNFLTKVKTADETLIVLNKLSADPIK
jgi:hypothetical protein